MQVNTWIRITWNRDHTVPEGHSWWRAPQDRGWFWVSVLLESCAGWLQTAQQTRWWGCRQTPGGWPAIWEEGEGREGERGREGGREGGREEPRMLKTSVGTYSKQHRLYCRLWPTCWHRCWGSRLSGCSPPSPRSPAWRPPASGRPGCWRPPWGSLGSGSRSESEWWTPAASAAETWPRRNAANSGWRRNSLRV